MLFLLLPFLSASSARSFTVPAFPTSGSSRLCPLRSTAVDAPGKQLAGSWQASRRVPRTSDPGKRAGEGSVPVQGQPGSGYPAEATPTASFRKELSARLESGPAGGRLAGRSVSRSVGQSVGRLVGCIFSGGEMLWEQEQCLNARYRGGECPGVCFHSTPQSRAAASPTGAPRVRGVSSSLG